MTQTPLGDEIKSKRAYDVKHFPVLGSQNSMVAKIYPGIIHYNNKYGVGDGVLGFRDIDNTPQWSAARNRWEILYNNFQAAIAATSDGTFGYRDSYQGKDQTTTFTCVGTNAVAGVLMNDGAIPRIGKSYVVYPDAYGTGTDLIVGARNNSLVKLVRIRSGFYPSADVSFVFNVKIPAGMKAYQGTSWQTAASGLQVSNGTQLTAANLPSLVNTLPIYIGNDQADGQNWYTKIQPQRVWDSAPTIYTGPNTATTQKVAFLPWNLAWDATNKWVVQTKTIPLTFFTGATGDIYTDLVVSLADSQDSYYGTSFSLGPNDGLTIMHVGGFGDNYYSFVQFNLGSAPNINATVQAILALTESGVNSISPQASANRVSATWSAGTLTSTVNPTIDTTGYTTRFAEDWKLADQWIQLADITKLYKDWINGVVSNFGVRLNHNAPTSSNSDTSIYTMEQADYRVPVLNVYYNDPKPSYSFAANNMMRLNYNAIRPARFKPGRAR